MKGAEHTLLESVSGRKRTAQLGEQIKNIRKSKKKKILEIKIIRLNFLTEKIKN